ncbi:MAG TPA: SOS response-associated peptidase family protein [Candidatus Thermoplasmatota archaeon]|nr:SOS response-associated peptidase family protein [Candidatus Thermoplasmatota archaeon]
MAGVIGLRGPDISKRDALRGYKVEWKDADRPLIRPHTGLPVLYLKEGEPVVERHVFGFSKEFSSFNARADKLETGKMWSRMFGKSHGVAPVSYILEWADMGDGKRAYRIERADGSAMAVPALVGPYWEDRSRRAFSLVTIEPNEFVRTFHDRMIGQLDDGHVDVWLNPEKHTPKELWSCLAAPPDEELVAYPLGADVGSAKFDDAGAMEAVGPAVTWKDVRSSPAAAASGGPSKKAVRQRTL